MITPPRKFRRSLSLEPLSPRQMLSVNVELLMDINFGNTSAVTRPDVLEGEFFLDYESTLAWEWIEFDGHLYFAADDGVHGMELWKTDGTEDGTDMVADIFAASDSSQPTGLTVFNGELYFAASDGDFGDELWKTDGTDVGTVRVKDIWVGPNNALPRDFAVYNDEMYFSAGAEAEGDELWKTDGTEEGTVFGERHCGGRIRIIPSVASRVLKTSFTSQQLHWTMGPNYSSPMARRKVPS